jgi:hypothetical protein
MHRFEGCFEAAEGRHNDGHGGRWLLAKFFEQALAVETGHVQVGDDDVGIERPSKPRGRERHPKPFSLHSPRRK